MGRNEELAGVSTNPGESVADQQQVEEVQVERNVVDEVPELEPRQVEDTKVIFVPFEDFEGRINQTTNQFRKDIPIEVSRQDANIWLEAKKGYIK